MAFRQSCSLNPQDGLKSCHSQPPGGPSAVARCANTANFVLHYLHQRHAITWLEDHHLLLQFFHPTSLTYDLSFHRSRPLSTAFCCRPEGWIPAPPLPRPQKWRALRRCGGWPRGGAERLARGTSSATSTCGSSRDSSGRRETRMQSRGPSLFGATGMKLNSPRP